MGKFSGYLMVSDLDKTFFAEGTDIPPRNIEAVRYFIENGGRFTLATGRGAVAAKLIAKDIPKNAPAILFNGAMLYDMGSDEIVETHGVSSPSIVELLRSIITDYPSVMLVIFKLHLELNAALGIDFVDSNLSAVLNSYAVSCCAAGKGADAADFPCVRCFASATSGQYGNCHDGTKNKT